MGGGEGGVFLLASAFKGFILKLDMATSIFLNIFVQDCRILDQLVSPDMGWYRYDPILIPLLANRTIGVSANDGKWHAICVTWDNENGTYQFFKDGAMEKQGTDFMKGYTIKAGGSLVLGQDQDNVGGGFKSSECFRGTLTNVNVWSYVLPKKAIIAFSKSCSFGMGDVYKWSDFKYGVKGKTAVEMPSSCSPINNC